MPDIIQDVSNSTLASPNADFGQKPCARLPPPLNRKDVMAQIGEQEGWDEVDLEGDLLISTRRQKNSPVICQPTRVEAAPLADGFRPSQDTSSPTPSAITKRRLFVNPRLIEMAIPQLHETSRLQPRAETLTRDAATPIQCVEHSAKPSEDSSDKGLVLDFAQLQYVSMSKPNPEMSDEMSRRRDSLSMSPAMDHIRSCPGNKSPRGQMAIKDGKKNGPNVEQETDLEALLDISQRYNQLQVKPGHDEPRNKTTACSKSRANPYSRISAEAWRTQSRHLQASAAGNEDGRLSRLDLEQREERLRGLTGMSASSQKINHSLAGRQQCSPRPDPQPTPRPIRRPVSRPISDLSTKEASSSANIRHDMDDTLVKSLGNTAGRLGKRLDINLDDFHQVVKEAERLKSQKKDLEIIENIFRSIATLRAVDELSDKEESEVSECRKFVDLVVNQGQAGNARRPRMRQIRDNMQSRISRVDETYLSNDGSKIERLYKIYLGEQLASEISAALRRIDEEIEEISVQRYRLQKTRHSSKKPAITKTRPGKGAPVKLNNAKRVRFDSPLEEFEGESGRSVGTAKEIETGSNSRARKRAKKISKGDREIQALYESRESFVSKDAASKNMQSAANDANENPTERDEAGHDGSQTLQQSSWFVQHGRPSGGNGKDGEMDEINKLENERQCNEVRASEPVGQLFDPEIVARMKQRTLEAGKIIMTGEEEEVEEQIELLDWSDADSDGSTASSSSTSSEAERTAELYKYTVKGQFVGIQTYSDGDLITFKTFWKVGNAATYLQEVIKSVHQEYMDKCEGHFELQHRHHKGLDEQILTIGVSGEVQARVWIERELVLVDTCKLAASKARKRQLVQSDELYQVTWEKTTTTSREDDRHAGSDGDVCNKVNSSASASASASGSASNTTATTTTTTTERCPNPVMHRDLASANRMAKEDFMLWYSQWYPIEERKHSHITEQGTIFWDYSGFLRQVNEAHEATLERLGDIGYFDAEEEVVLREDDDTAAGGQVIKTEKMKVYVKPVIVLGPRN